MVTETPQPIEHQILPSPPLAPPPVAALSPIHQPIHEAPEVSAEQRSISYPLNFEHPKPGLINSQNTRFPNALQNVTVSEGQRGRKGDIGSQNFPTTSDSHHHGLVRVSDSNHTNSLLLATANDSAGSIERSHNAPINKPSGVIDGSASSKEQDTNKGHLKSSDYQNLKSCCCNTSIESASPAGPTLPTITNASPLHEPHISSQAPHPNTIQMDKFPEKRKIFEDTAFLHNNLTFHTPLVPQTTVYNMPATYATAENPLTQRQQAYFQQNGHFYSQNVPHYAPLGVVGSAAPSAEGNAVLSLTHSCTCGPSCQCVFCVAHPYNATTRDRVQTLAHLLPDETEYVPRSPLQASFKPRFQTSAESSPMVPATNRMHINEILHPSDLSQSTPFSPADFGSEIYQEIPNGSLGEVTQPAISSAEYLTMAYDYNPMELGRCTDATGTCRCGDDCTCIGCWTHSGHEE